MTLQELGLKLHDRATRGENLTPSEKLQLQQWYDFQDAQEAALLQTENASPDIEHLHEQVSNTLKQVAESAQQIQKVSAENAALRREISHLYQQLDATKSA